MDEVRHDGRVVIATGAGRGMGRAHALELARRGARVVVNDVGSALDGTGTSADPAEGVAAEIVAAGGSALASVDTVATAAGCEAIVAATVERFGGVDAIVHNAGIGSRVAVADMGAEELEPVVRVHLFGAVHLTRAAWPHLARRRTGRVLYISSGAGWYGAPHLGHYGPAKTGLLSLARVVSAEGAEAGIAANALSVFAMTRMSEGRFAGDPAAARWWREHLRPELVSAAVAWLVHPGCAVAGRAYSAMGGRVARAFLAETRGYTDPELTAEAVRDHFAEIEDASEWHEPADAEAPVRFTLDRLAERGVRRPPTDFAQA